MKKIMLMLAVAVSVVLAHAATVEWSMSGLVQYGGTAAPTDYLIYWIDNADVARETAIADIGAAKFTFVTSAHLFDDYDSGEAVGSVAGYANSTTVNGYLVIFNADDVADATYAYVSALDSNTTGATGQSAMLSYDVSGSATAGNWTAVPEPTSGLLLLVGGALLALKRRRA